VPWSGCCFPPLGAPRLFSPHGAPLGPDAHLPPGGAGPGAPPGLHPFSLGSPAPKLRADPQLRAWRGVPGRRPPPRGRWRGADPGLYFIAVGTARGFPDHLHAGGVPLGQTGGREILHQTVLYYTVLSCCSCAALSCTLNRSPLCCRAS